MNAGADGVLLIRADAGATIGMGHVLRCLALAQAWQDRGNTVVYATVALPPRARLRLEKEGVMVVEAEVTPGSAADQEWTIELAQTLGARVVVDGYAFGPRYANRLVDAGLRVLLLDDDGEDGPIRALVLNQNLHGHTELYPNATGGVLVGLAYALLRRELRGVRRAPMTVPEHARTALVNFGGADPASLSAPAAQCLLDAGLEEVHVVLGPAARPIELSASALKVHIDPPNFFEIAAAADLGVLAAGSSVWEMAYLGVPMALVSTVANQVANHAVVVAAGLAVGLGDVQAFAARRAESTEILTRFAADSAQRRDLRQRGRERVDGQGAARVAAALAAM